MQQLWSIIDFETYRFINGLLKLQERFCLFFNLDFRNSHHVETMYIFTILLLAVYIQASVILTFVLFTESVLYKPREINGHLTQ